MACDIPYSNGLQNYPQSCARTGLYADYSLFVYRKWEVFMSLLVYVEDIMLASNNAATSLVLRLRVDLKGCFYINANMLLR